jgi:RNA polymerase sigma-70 factor (ECF subfamily)
VLALQRAPEPVPADFRAVYEENFAYIWAVLRRLGVYERELEDAVHDVFIVFHRRLKDFDDSRPVRPWLCGIATRVASDFRRRARVRHETAFAEPAAVDPGRSPEEGAAAREARALVKRALDELSWERRVMIVLCDIEGYSVPSLVDVLEVPLNTLYSRLRLARRDFTAAVRALRGETET